MIERYVAQFDEFVRDGARSAPSQVNALRTRAMESFASLGFPTTKNEDWHFTSVSPITEHEFTFVAAETGDVQESDITQFAFADDWHTAVFVNGRFAQELSSLDDLERGVRFVSLADAWSTAPELAQRVGTIVSAPEQHAFTQLNTAFMPDGAIVHVGKDARVLHPIHLVFVTDANAAKTVMYPRNLIVLERGAKATVVESYVSLSDATYFTNAVTEVSVGDGATLEHIKIQRESRRAFHVGTIEADQARDSHYISFSFSTGGELSRTNIYSNLDGEGCGSTLNGLYMLDGEQHGDHQTRIEHTQPNCFSREVYKGVLDGRSHGVFNGKVYVHPIAQKTDGKQTNNTLLLSKDARVDTKPQLEIFADDVKCTHGATVGRLDEQALFYMKSRGVNAETARRLLVYAFAADVLETIEQPELREALERVTLERFVKTEELSVVSG
ncbi:MAG TPA: Fe-S cluster assembly protein SufD [Gemmatimonadaceae bacterium]|nr:Fe-S cluster assembly protein SufD [Gemmatimonadaceae bacterium]